MVKYLIILFLLVVTFQPKHIFAEKYNLTPDSLNLNIVLSQDFNKVKSDSWLGVDKAAHIAGSCMLTVALNEGLHHLAGYSGEKSTQFSMGVTLSLGIGKEIRDSAQPGNKFSFKDIIADIVGIGIGLLLISAE